MGDPLFPKVNVKIYKLFSIQINIDAVKKKYWQNFNFLVKTKNVPKGLKCKINYIFFLNKGFLKGGGGPPFGKNSQIIP